MGYLDLRNKNIIILPLWQINLLKLAKITLFKL